jgi:hypothetical protein
MKRDPRSAVEYLPPPHVVVGAASLESFHPQRSSHPVDNTKLTWRKALHFITTTIATKEEDGSEKVKRRGQRKGLNTLRPLGASIYSQRWCAMSGSRPSDQPSVATKDLGELARRPFNPYSTPLGGCVMMATQ